MWRHDPSYLGLVKDLWGDAHSVHNLDQLPHKLGRMQESFQRWEQSIFGSVKRELRSLRKELEAEWGLSLLAGPSRREKQLMARISELLAREEIMEKQRLRII